MLWASAQGGAIQLRLGMESLTEYGTRIREPRIQNGDEDVAESQLDFTNETADHMPMIINNVVEHNQVLENDAGCRPSLKANTYTR